MRNIEYMHPLAPLQRSMLFHTLRTPESRVYVVQDRHRISAEMDVDAFRAAWANVLARHQSLRSCFVWKNLTAPVQVVHQKLELPFRMLDWRGFPAAVQEQQIEEFLGDQRRQGFNLTESPLMSLTLVRLAEDNFEFIWCYHHMVVDGWSKALVLNEVTTVYLAGREGRPLRLPPAASFQDYVAWLYRQDLTKAEGFWRSYLKGFHRPTRLPQDRGPGPGSAVESNYTSLRWRLPLALTEQLRAVGRRWHVTLSTMIQATWAILLARYTGETDVLFGMVVAGRPAELPGIESIVGSLINTLPVRLEVSADQLTADFVKRFQEDQLELRQHEYSPLNDVHGWSEVSAGAPLFDTLLIVENAPEFRHDRRSTGTEEWQEPGLPVRQQSVPEHFAVPFNVAIVSPAAGPSVGIQVTYDAARFEAGSVDRMLAHWQHLMEALVANPGGFLSDLSLLNAAETTQMLVEWNSTAAAVPEPPISVLFEAWETLRPDAVAVVSDSEHVTYGALNRRANQLAHALREFGVGPEVLVGLCVQRSPALIAALLGILKSGAAYVPLDPSWPAQRLAFVLDDAGPAVLVADASVVQSLPSTDVQPILVDPEDADLSAEPDINLAHPGVDQLAYVIYTSGSAGRPKGVAVIHSSILNLAAVQVEAFGINDSSRVLQFASMVFDAAVSEWSTTWMAGATLVLASQDVVTSTTDLMACMREQAITVATLPPSLLAILPQSDLPALETLIVAGEACSGQVVRQWSRGRRMLNAYGPTETTVCATISTPLEGDEPPPIGRPIANAQVYVTGRSGQLAPIDVPGDLCVGGAGIARGYWRSPALTAERFVPDAWSGKCGARLYRTGDLVKYRPDGVLDFLRRQDFQVKVRGFRIELGEIEAALRQLAGVRDAVVALREDGLEQRQLAAYVVGEAEAGTLRVQLQDLLPAYMIPTAWIPVERLPLTASGKVDRERLPMPPRVPPERAAQVSLSPAEELLAGIWADVLKRDQIQPGDDFFALGGHSLTATQVSSRARQIFGVELPVRQIFETPRLSDLAASIEQGRRAPQPLDTPPLLPCARTGPLRLSFGQQRLWFLDQLMPDSPAYNLNSALRLGGGVRLDVLQRVFEAIIRRHEILRTRFVRLDGVPFQIVESAVPWHLPLIDLSVLSAEVRERVVKQLAREEALTPFDLESAPLLRAAAVRLGCEDHALFCTTHHIISDGWSMGILIREVSQLYSAFSAGSDSPLEDLPVQYGDFAEWQHGWLQGQVLERQLQHWRQQLGRELPALDLPADYPRAATPNSRGAAESFRLSQELTTQLHALGRDEGVTLFMLLLAAFQILLAKCSGQTTVVVGSPIAGRTRLELEHLIGFFINTLVYRLDLTGGPTVRDVLRRARESALGAYAHQDMPFERLVDDLAADRDPSRSPIFQATFTLENTPVESLQLGELSFRSLGVEGETAHFDLSMAVTQRSGQLFGSLNYRIDLFKPATIRRLLHHWQALLAGMVANPGRRIDELPLVSDAERRGLLTQWAAAESPKSGSCLHALFEARAALEPDSVAVVCGTRQLSYAGLNRRADRLARRLRRLGVGPEVRVGLCVERSLEMTIGLLGILKAGGAYVPLDPAYPRARISFLVEDSQASVVVTRQTIGEELGFGDRAQVWLDEDVDPIAGRDELDSWFEVAPEHLAYVIYTSGSTGTPKGVLVDHQAVSGYACSMAKRLDLRPGDRILQFAPLSFDVLAEEVFPAWAAGASVVIPARNELLSAPLELFEMMERQGVTGVEFPTAYWRQCLQELIDSGRRLPSPLRFVIVGGEKASAESLSAWERYDVPLIHVFGLTETTVTSMCEEFRADAGDSRPQPWSLGQPLPGTQVYLLDPALEPVPAGVLGEMFIAGAGLARGYWNRPDFTAEKFIPNPYGECPGERMFRTGDVSRHNGGGCMEFIGRRDDQVRVRGIRLELGELASALEQGRGVRQAVVKVVEATSGVPQLVAYVIPEREEALQMDDLRSSLQRDLPEYMLPGAIVALEEFPLTPNGKIDLAALPAPNARRTKAGSVAPCNAVERVLAEIWSEVLNLEQVGVEDNFFHLGGHSLLATQVVSRVRKLLRTEISLYRLFEKPTIRELAKTILSDPERGGEVDRVANWFIRVKSLPTEEVNRLLVGGN